MYSRFHRLYSRTYDNSTTTQQSTMRSKMTTSSSASEPLSPRPFSSTLFCQPFLQLATSSSIVTYSIDSLMDWRKLPTRSLRSHIANASHRPNASAQPLPPTQKQTRRLEILSLLYEAPLKCRRTDFNSQTRSVTSIARRTSVQMDRRYEEMDHLADHCWRRSTKP